MRLSVSLPLSLSLLATGIAAVHAAEEPVYELITTAIHRQQSETALPVTVLTGEGLHSQVRATLGDTLANQPGISNASFGPAVGQTVIRGQQGRRVMNLTNAMPNIDASGNSADHAQGVEPLLAESVEVLRGPATLLYGSGAIGGVVNVLDRRIGRRPLDAPAFAFEGRHDSAADNTTVVGSADFSSGNFRNGSLVWHLDGMQREWNDMEIPGFAIDPDWLAFEAAREAA
ncbi:MAG TPA: Plug domain-containing protein, partial [Pseudomonadaceae bacterium]|nr:Plug domain-containing protein [Pseudomonadaceae bacterium]